MGKKQMPEGLEEMAKYEDAIDRRELQSVYQELFEEVQDTSLDRRTLLTAFAGGGGLATLNALFAQKKFMGDDLESGLKAIAAASDHPFGVRQVDEPPYEVDDEIYERFDGSKMDFRIEDAYGANAGNIGEPDTSKGGMITQIENATAGAGSQTIGNVPPIRMSDSGESRSIIALSEAVDVEMNTKFGFMNAGWGTHVNREKVTFDEMYGLDEHPLRNRTPDLTDPARLTNKVKHVARLAGVGDVGIGKRDDRWIYSHSEWGHPINFTDSVDKLTVEDGEYYWPNDIDKTIVLAVEMPRTFGRMGYSYGGGTCSDIGYMRQSLALAVITRWIKLMGYEAIPSGNDLGPTVPTAIDAGLGQYGRHGRLIHPQFGSNLRVSKIYTNMPLEPDGWIEFGATEFCKACKICAEECPAGQISTGERTWKYEGPGEGYSKADGVYKWYCNSAHCMKFWRENGTNDSQCMNVCPFTQGRSKVHDIVRSIAGGPFDGTLADMSSTFGYHDYLHPEDAWATNFLPYGISQDPDLGGQ